MAKKKSQKILIMDTKNKQVLVYSETGLEVVSFAECRKLFRNSREFIVASSVKKMNTEDIVKFIYQTGAQIDESIPVPGKDNGLRYIHPALNQSMFINEYLSFSGKYDCRLIDSAMKNMITSNPVLQDLIRSGGLEIIDDFDRRELLREKKNGGVSSKNNPVNSRTRDDDFVYGEKKGLDGVRIEGGVAILDNDDIGEDIDINGGGVEGLGVKTMSELESIADWK